MMLVLVCAGPLHNVFTGWRGILRLHTGAQGWHACIHLLRRPCLPCCPALPGPAPQASAPPPRCSSWPANTRCWTAPASLSWCVCCGMAISSCLLAPVHMPCWAAPSQRAFATCGLLLMFELLLAVDISCCDVMFVFSWLCLLLTHLTVAVVAAAGGGGRGAQRHVCRAAHGLRASSGGRAAAARHRRPLENRGGGAQLRCGLLLLDKSAIITLLACSLPGKRNFLLLLHCNHAILILAINLQARL